MTAIANTIAKSSSGRSMRSSSHPIRVGVEAAVEAAGVTVVRDKANSKTTVKVNLRDNLQLKDNLHRRAKVSLRYSDRRDNLHLRGNRHSRRRKARMVHRPQLGKPGRRRTARRQ
jgi:hypothetical protein